MSENESQNTLAVPLRWKEGEKGEENYYDAIKAIREAQSALVNAYDAFIGTCQRQGMNIYAPTSD